MTDAHRSLPAGMAQADLEAEALLFARGDRVRAEARLARLAQAAVAAWRLDDAIFWQRVKFRARQVRAVGSRGEAAPERKERAC